MQVVCSNWKLACNELSANDATVSVSDKAYMNGKSPELGEKMYRKY